MASLNQTAKKTVRYLREKGVWETAKKAGRHFGRKREERRFAAAMALTPEERQRQREMKFSRPVLISVAVPLYNTPEDLLGEMIDSVCAQTYGEWELCLADGSDEAHGAVGDYCRARAAKEPRIKYRKLEKNEGISGNSNRALEMAGGEYISLLDHDDLLTENALFEVRSAIEQTGADFLYSDEMVFQSPNPKKIIGIRVKPGFSPDTLLSNNYICHLTTFSRALLDRAGGFRSAFDGSQDHDLILRLTDQARGIAHIAKVLYLWRAIPASTAMDIGSKTYAIDAGKAAVRTFLRERRGIDAGVESTEVFPTMYRVKYPIAGNPSVRVIVDAARDRDAAEEKLQALQRSAGWDHAVWQVLGRDDAETALPRSARWNRAARAAAEDYLLFLDGVPEAMGGGWLREMLSYAQLPHTGAVGAKMHFQRGTVRHAGLVLGMGPAGIAGRPYYVEMEDREGYFGMIAVAEDVAAVTDVLLVSREKLEAAGGFSEEYEDALFDVDLCVRLMEKGYYNVFTPYARLKMGTAKQIPFEAGKEYDSWPRDAEVFRKRNARILQSGDPYFNPNLSPEYEDWRLKKV